MENLRLVGILFVFYFKLNIGEILRDFHLDKSCIMRDNFEIT